MPLWPIVVGACILLVFWTIIPGVRHWRYRRAIRDRLPAESQWAAEFPSAMPTVEQVLTIFSDAFLLNRRYRFHFRPEDTVADVYKGTTGPIADEMQLETLVRDIDESFGVDLVDSFTENTTLRDIVVLVVESSRKVERQ